MIPIAKEVRLVLLGIGIAIAVAQYQIATEVLWLAWLMYSFLLFLFRDFHRAIPAIPLAIVSPIDGKVIDVEKVHDPYLNRTSKCIHLRQSTLGEFNVHSPVEGKVQNLWVDSPTDPDVSQLAIWVQTDEQDDAVLCANLNSIIRHASCTVSVGEKLGQGQRCGFIALATEITIFLPESAHIAIKIGQSVRAGSDKLAEFIHNSTN